MDILKTILESGLSGKDTRSLKREILLTNYISLILSSAIIILFIVRTTLFNTIHGGINIVTMALGLIVFIVPLILNRLSFTSVSRLFCSIAPLLFIWAVSINLLYKNPAIEIVSYDSLRFFLLAVSPIPYLLFDKKENYIFFIAILPCLISFCFFDTILHLFSLNYIDKGIVSKEYPVMQLRTMVVYFVLSGACFAFRTIISKTDALNTKILEELKLKSKQIESQNQQLLYQKETLYEFNKNLEITIQRKTIDLKKKNERIIKYAFSNSHRVRACLARILGLINISKLDQNTRLDWYFEKIDYEAKEMDKVIKIIATDLSSESIE